MSTARDGCLGGLMSQHDLAHLFRPDLTGNTTEKDIGEGGGGDPTTTNDALIEHISVQQGTSTRNRKTSSQTQVAKKPIQKSVDAVVENSIVVIDANNMHKFIEPLSSPITQLLFFTYNKKSCFQSSLLSIVNPPLSILNQSMMSTTEHNRLKINILKCIMDILQDHRYCTFIHFLLLYLLYSLKNVCLSYSIFEVFFAIHQSSHDLSVETKTTTTTPTPPNSAVSHMSSSSRSNRQTSATTNDEPSPTMPNFCSRLGSELCRIENVLPLLTGDWAYGVVMGADEFNSRSTYLPECATEGVEFAIQVQINSCYCFCFVSCMNGRYLYSFV